ncbi:MAG: SSI family serine proteinase inhibitor [Streptosporangiaceae bacterium]
MTIYSANNAAPAHYTLRCEPAGGTVPDPAAACAQLLADPDLLAPRPAPAMCPMILATSAHAVVDGTYLGRQVSETIGDGGCDVQRFDKLRQIVQVTG